jgi:hypothetical protein
VDDLISRLARRGDRIEWGQRRFVGEVNQSRRQHATDHEESSYTVHHFSSLRDRPRDALCQLRVRSRTVDAERSKQKPKGKIFLF